MRARIFITLVTIVTIFTFSFLMVDQNRNLPYKAYYNNLTADAKTQVECLAENIYFEAGHESDEGKIAVAFVTLNRVNSGRFENNICGVVKQKTGNTCQFSWYCEDKAKAISTGQVLTNRPNSLYNDIRNLAVYVYANYEKMEDPSKGALFYHADYVNPKWPNMIHTTTVGRQIFYKRKGMES